MSSDAPAASRQVLQEAGAAGSDAELADARFHKTARFRSQAEARFRACRGETL
ncbi:hypothetical protein OKW44_002111 [Paraburkholderia sp. WSM4174]